MRVNHTLASAATAVALVLFSGLAQAKPDESKRSQARSHFSSGSKYYNLREYEKALEDFRAAYILTGEASLLFNIAQCERQLKRFEDARKSFLSYLREARPSDDQTAEVRRLIASLEEAHGVEQPPAAGAASIDPPHSNQDTTARDVEPPTKAAETPAAPPAPAALTASGNLTQSTVRDKPRTRPWVWPVLGTGVVLVGVGVGVGLGVGLTRGSRYPHATEGVIDGN